MVGRECKQLLRAAHIWVHADNYYPLTLHGGLGIILGSLMSDIPAPLFLKLDHTLFALTVN